MTPQRFRSGSTRISFAAVLVLFLSTICIAQTDELPVPSAAPVTHKFRTFRFNDGGDDSMPNKQYLRTIAAWERQLATSQHSCSVLQRY